METRLIKFSKKDISDFVTVTEDNNVLHNADFMNEQGLIPIVPGLQVVGHMLSMAPELLEQPSRFNISFNDSKDREARIESSLKVRPGFVFPEVGYDLIASPVNGHEMRYFFGNKSSLETFYNPHKTKLLKSSGSQHTHLTGLESTVNGFDRLSDMFSTENEGVLKLITALGKSSGALFQAYGPQLDGKVPVYSDLHVEFPNGAIADYDRMIINISQIARDNPKQAGFEIIANTSNDQTLYTARVVLDIVENRTANVLIKRSMPKYQIANQ